MAIGGKIDRVALEAGALEAARILLGVARLGDMSLRGWWSSRALDFEGTFILGNAFRRTGRVVGLELALLSATRRHRQALSRPTAVHLFSDQMPFHRWTAGWLAEQKTSGVDPLFDELKQWEDPVTAGGRLARWAGAAPSSREIAGALELGPLKRAELDDPLLLLDRVRALAACYCDMVEFRPAYFNLSD